MDACLWLCSLIDQNNVQVNCFIVRKGAKGLRTEKIQNKISLRCVQNAGAVAAYLLCVPHSVLLCDITAAQASHDGLAGCADIYLDDCFVADSARLPGVNSFKARTNALCSMLMC